MKKTAIILLTSFLSFQLFAQSSSSVQIVKDRTFELGLLIRGHTSALPAPIGNIYPYGKYSGEDPIWLVAQWGSKNIFSSPYPVTSNDTIIYENRAKRLYFIADENGKKKVGLEVRASKEYTAPRKEGEEWTHLLIEQGFTDKVMLKDLSCLRYNMGARLLFCENRMNGEFNGQLHTAQITLFITIQNSNDESLNYVDFFWFGLPLYDYRYEEIPEYAAEDLGKEDATRKFIYTVASSQLFSKSMHSMEEIIIDKDIYPLIENAFKTAQEKGYMKNCSWDDLSITSLNVGWEVPGTFDCGILIDTPSLVATFN